VGGCVLFDLVVEAEERVASMWAFSALFSRTRTWERQTVHNAACTGTHRNQMTQLH